MDLTNIEDLRTAMRLAGIKPKKGLGQHFLIDAKSLERIVEAAELKPKDTVLEIGPGLGVMTNLLARQAGRVVAVETDAILAELLGRDKPKNLEVRHEDVMQFDLSQLPSNYKVVANIPYYLTSQIFRLLLESPNPPNLMSLLIQREVAERIVALPGKLSVLALSVQYYAEPELVTVVERHKFWPSPRVDSAVLKVKLRPMPAFEANSDKLFRLIKAGFGEKRKQLKNSLAGGLNCSIELAIELLNNARIEPTARAQELTLEQWQRLYLQATRRGLL